MEVEILYYQDVGNYKRGRTTRAKIIVPIYTNYRLIDIDSGYIMLGEVLDNIRTYYLSIDFSTSKYLRKKSIIYNIIHYIEIRIDPKLQCYHELTDLPEYPYLQREDIIRIDTIEIENSLVNNTLMTNNLTEEELDKKLSRL